MTFEEWDAVTPDYGQNTGFVNGQGSTMTMPSTRESRFKQYQDSLTSEDINTLVNQAANIPTGTNIDTFDGPDGYFGENVLDASGDSFTVPSQVKNVTTITTTGDKLTTKNVDTDENNNTRTVIEDTDITGSDGNSVIDSILGFMGIGEVSAGDDTDETNFIPPTSLETPVPTGVYESGFFDDVDGYYGEIVDGRPIDPRVPPVKGQLVPKYIQDGSGATIPNPAWTEENGESRATREQDELNRLIRGTPQKDAEAAWKNMQTQSDVFTEGDLVYNEKTDTFEIPGGYRIGDKKSQAYMFQAELDKIESERKMLEESILNNIDLPIQQTKKSEETKDMVEDAVKVISTEAPAELNRLNDFALWADGVSDDAALREAEAVLDQINNAPNVTDRFKKAMAVAMGAMLFGDDFATAMNTGLGVVADDYATEAAAAKEISDANIALQKKLAEEYRSLQMDDYKSARDSAESLSNSVQLANHNANIKALEEQAKAGAKRQKDNMDAGTKIMDSIKASMAGDDNIQTFMNRNDMDGEMSGLINVLETQSPDGFSLNFNNAEQRHAISGVLNKWIRERSQYGEGAAPLAAYASEFFIKSELEEFAGIDPSQIAPSRADLEARPTIGMPGREEKLYVEMNNLPFGTRDGTEATLKLGKRIQDLGAQGLGEKGVTALLWKDYQDFKRQSYENFSKKKVKVGQDDPFTTMERIAYNKGWGPFTQFVLVNMAGKLNADNIGMNFDSVLKGESEEVQDIAMTSYMTNGSYNIEQIKSQLKSK